MTRKSNFSTLVRASVIVGIEGIKGFYTWKTWLLGWLLRVLFQVTFFSLVGKLLGSPERVYFLLVGSAAGIAVLEAMTIVLYSSDDRQYGMLPLLVASPGDYFVVSLARNLNCSVTGTVTASIALFLCAPVVGVSLPMPDALLVIPLIALGSFTTYLFGTFLGAIVAKTIYGRWLVFNVAYMSIVAFCGFLVPLGFWPTPLDALAEVMPFTHALKAIRALLAEAGTGPVMAQVGIELVLLGVWLVLAKLAFSASIALARKDGSIDLSAA